MPQTTVEATAFAILLLSSVVAIFTMIRSRVWKLSRVVGRAKPPAIAIAGLALTAVVAFVTSIAAGGVVATLISTGQIAATQPTTQVATTAPSALPASTILWASAISPVVALAVAIGLLKLLDPQGLAWIGFTKEDLRGSLIPMLASVVTILTITFASMILFNAIYDAIGYQHETEHPLLRSIAENPELFPLLILSAAIIVPVFEELVFRGCLQTALVILFTRREVAGRWMAILVTSVVFALAHGELWMMPPLVVLSIGLGYVYERTGKLWVPMVVHAAFNATSLVLFAVK